MGFFLKIQYINRIDFFLFVYIKTFLQRIFLYINGNYNDCHKLKKTCTFYIYKAKKMRNVFIYKKLDTFQKARKFPLLEYTKSRTLYVT